MEASAAAFVQSELFARTFREGMRLVEAAANYLDGEGRKASKKLPRDAALAYAGASMRLTTQLMQIASWLLVLRAVREGDMAVDEARDGKYRLKANENEQQISADQGLPETLTDLIGETDQLFSRISRLDATLFAEHRAGSDRDAAAQQRALFKAFNG
ncbi:MAG: DUF1465 family protein [Parvularculaceae bacterium]